MILFDEYKNYIGNTLTWNFLLFRFKGEYKW
ncbi:hypothetical protein SCORR_v1c08470 [Spiroplasma corruscae]|uniref:Uncharacterized protein n=1 Tax=Spiroplasma corruscae TaxID=216934 RepID=A0A222EQ05_9MOLU|nr:hypothetical protein SCORR_v1c08470 [Spiroplasma corruscae]